MNLFTLGSFTDFKNLCTDASLDALELSVAHNIHDLLVANYDKWGFDNDLKVASIASIIQMVAPDNPVAKQLSLLALRVSLKGIADRAMTALMESDVVRSLLEEKEDKAGDLVGVKDSKLITQIVAARLAETRRQRTERGEFRFNAQESTGVEINLVPAIHQPGVLMEIVQAQYRADKAKNSAFANFFAPIADDQQLLFNAQGNKGVVVDDWDDENVRWDAIDQMVQAKALDVVDATPPHETKTVAEGVRASSGCDFDKPLTKERLNHTASIKINGKVISVNRMDLFKRIAWDLDKAINPAYMTSWINKNGVIEDGSLKMQASQLVPLAVPYNSVYETGAFKNDPHYNHQAVVGVSVETADVIDVTPVQSSKEKEQLFPIKKEQCKVANGNYRCPRCHKEGFKKAKINPYFPKSLPKNCPHDLEGLEESKLWAMSDICGPCSDVLKSQRERAASAWYKSNREIEVKVPEQEYTALQNFERYFIQADDNYKQAKKELTAVEAIAAPLGEQVPYSMARQIENLRFNVQTCYGAVVAMNAKVEEQERKISALKSGAATWVAEPKELPAPVAKATTTPAVIIAAPVKQTKLTRKEKRLGFRRKF